MFCRIALVSLNLALVNAASADDSLPATVKSASEVIAEVARTGAFEHATINDDLDLARIAGPAQSVEFRDGNFRGRLKGAPKFSLKVTGGSICALEAGRSEWTKPAEFKAVKFGSLIIRQSQINAPWACLECTICRAEAESARFGAGATFIAAQFGAGEPQRICIEAARRKCAASNFAETTFTGAARFDGAKFQSAANFDGADFAEGARFPRAYASAPMSFIGARFRRDAEFRDCRFASVYFGPANAGARFTSNESTEFASRADFRGCQFAGSVSFNGANFEGDALFARAVAAGPAFSLLGVLSTRSIDLRGFAFPNPEGKLRLDASSADALLVDWDQFGPAVLRGQLDDPRDQRAATLDALERRFGSLNESHAARKVGFEAKRERRTHGENCGDASVGICLATEAEWFLWTLPTRNGTDLTWLAAALVVLWFATATAALAFGQIVAFPRRPDADLPAVYECAPQDPIPRDAFFPGPVPRLFAAAGFATGLVFKLDSRRQRWIAPRSPRRRFAVASALGVAWLMSWLLILLTGKVLLTSFPGLDFIKFG